MIPFSDFIHSYASKSGHAHECVKDPSMSLKDSKKEETWGRTLKGWDFPMLPPLFPLSRKDKDREGIRGPQVLKADITSASIGYYRVGKYNSLLQLR